MLEKLLCLRRLIPNWTTHISTEKHFGLPLHRKFLFFYIFFLLPFLLCCLISIRAKPDAQCVQSFIIISQNPKHDVSRCDVEKKPRDFCCRTEEKKEEIDSYLHKAHAHTSGWGIFSCMHGVSKRQQLRVGLNSNTTIFFCSLGEFQDSRRVDMTQNVKVTADLGSYNFYWWIFVSLFSVFSLFGEFSFLFIPNLIRLGKHVNAFKGNF